jgi:hypothetical protein
MRVVHWFGTTKTGTTVIMKAKADAVLAVEILEHEGVYSECAILLQGNLRCIVCKGRRSGDIGSDLYKWLFAPWHKRLFASSDFIVPPGAS